MQAVLVAFGSVLTEDGKPDIALVLTQRLVDRCKRVYTEKHKKKFGKNLVKLSLSLINAPM
jgi:hypothetical protein